MTPARPKCDVLAIVIDVALMMENSAVFESQVAEQLLALHALGYEVALLAVANNQTSFDRVIGKRLRDAGVRIFLVSDRGFARNLVALAWELRQLRRRHSPRTAYVRSIWGALVLALSGSLSALPYVYDVRGALADETRATGRTRIKQRIYTALERWSIRRAARTSAVTRVLGEIVSKSYSVRHIEVVPCCVDVDSMSASSEAAAARRVELGFKASDIVLVYSGGLSHYQQVPAMLALWRQLRDETNTRFLLLTNTDPHSSPALVGDLGDFGERLCHLSLPRHEVPVTLAAADVGFMLRDARELNRVASPVKFAEYLAAGLAIVASPGTGDASDLIEQNDLGVLVDPGRLYEGEARLRHLLHKLADERNALRERATRVAREHYDWRGHRETFRRLYGPGTLHTS